MDTVVNDFVAHLRRHEVRISPAETLDALHGLLAVGLGDREVVRDTLRASLVKSGDDVETFERLFELYFGLRDVVKPEPKPLAMHGHDHGGPPTKLKLGEDLENEARGERTDAGSDENTDLRRFMQEDKLAAAPDLHGHEESLRLSLFAQELVLNRRQGSLEPLLEKISGRIRLRRARNIFQPGSLVSGADAQEIALDVSAAELGAFMDHLHELEVDDDVRAALEDNAEAIIEGLPELLEAMLARERAARSLPDERVLREQSLRKLVSYTGAEQRELEAAIRRMARHIHGAHSRRMRVDRTGRISLRHTMRGNLRHDGVPFEPVLHRRREGKPRLVLLCDVSLSTRNLARFWLHLVANLQGLFSKVRTFVYVADVAEVTQTFADKPLGEAVDAIFSGGLIDADVNSDFGRAAGQFAEAYADTVNRRTTVVILGDGRNNGRDPNPVALQEIAGRARSTIWITPEPRWSWSLGASDMPLYARLVDRVELVRTAGQLARVAESLVEEGARV